MSTLEHGHGFYFLGHAGELYSVSYVPSWDGSGFNWGIEVLASKPLEEDGYGGLDWYSVVDNFGGRIHVWRG